MTDPSSDGITVVGMEMVDALLRHLRRKARASSSIAPAPPLPRPMPAELRALLRALAIGRTADLGDWVLEARAVAPAHAALARVNARLDPHLRIEPERAAVIGAGAGGEALLATWGHDDDDHDGDDVIARGWSPWRDSPAAEVLLVAIDDPDDGFLDLGTLDELIDDALERVREDHAAPTPDLRAIASLVGCSLAA